MEVLEYQQQWYNEREEKWMDLEILEYERECYFEGEQKWSILGFLINGNGPLVEISTETDLKIEANTINVCLGLYLHHNFSNIQSLHIFIKNIMTDAIEIQDKIIETYKVCPIVQLDWRFINA